MVTRLSTTYISLACWMLSYVFEADGRVELSLFCINSCPITFEILVPQKRFYEIKQCLRIVRNVADEFQRRSILLSGRQW